MAGVAFRNIHHEEVPALATEPYPISVRNSDLIEFF